jgi:hypothetical protein
MFVALPTSIDSFNDLLAPISSDEPNMVQRHFVRHCAVAAVPARDQRA